MKTPCKVCLTAACACPNQENGSWKECATHMKSPVSHICNSVPQDKRFQRRLKNLLSNSPCTTIKESENERNDNFTSTPSKTTPPIIRNPFDLEINSLMTYSYSPSTFLITEKKPDEKTPFRWSIEQIAEMNPADIDETSHQSNGFCEDSETEIKAQEAIDAFFSKSHIVPSPWAPSFKGSMFSVTTSPGGNPCRAENDTDDNSSELSESDQHTVSTQTMLTIPPSIDLMSLLGHFYTYGTRPKQESMDGAMNNEDIPTPSTSFRRCKLFTNDDNKDDVLEHTPRIYEENNNDLAAKFLPADFTAWSPQSDNLSSSPKTPLKFSLSGCNEEIYIHSPGVSPICKQASDRISRNSRCNLEISMENAESNQDVTEDSLCTQEVNTCSANTQSVMMTSVSELDFGLSSTAYDPSKQSNFSSETRMVSGSSNQKDTGYLTGSITSMASMIFQQTFGDVQYRTTPVAELLGDCAINNKGEPYNNNSDVSFDMDECMVSINQSKCIDSYGVPSNFSNMPWQPNVFSTPSKSQVLAKTGTQNIFK